MSDQVSLVTTAARNAAAANAADFTNAVAQHISGDYGAHNQVNVYSGPFPISPNAPGATYGVHQITNALRVRLVVTIGGVDYAIVVPGFPVGAYTGGGTNSGGAGQIAPAFTQQPLSGQFALGTNITLTVAVSGTAPILIQWEKDGLSVSGANGLSFNIPSFSSGDVGNYVCVATNAVGQTFSSTASLAVQNTTSGSGTAGRPGVSGGCFTRNAFISLINGVQQPISSIVKGDVLRSYDLKGLNPSVENAWMQFAESNLVATPASTTVVGVLKSQFTYFFRINGELEVTLEHPLLTKRGSNWVFVQVKDLKIGDYLFKNGTAALVRSIVRVDTPIETWSLDVEPFDLYVANGYLVHNATLVQKL
jgi:hypothetical protein